MANEINIESVADLLSILDGLAEENRLLREDAKYTHARLAYIEGIALAGAKPNVKSYAKPNVTSYPTSPEHYGEYRGMPITNMHHDVYNQEINIRTSDGQLFKITENEWQNMRGNK